MSSNLVIVESPAKSKTIQKFLGKNFRVESCYGHIVDLPKSKMGIEIENNFKPNYVISSDKIKVVKKLRELAEKVDYIWLASDEDREGEAIAWHLSNELKIEKERVKRIVFHEITKSAIQRAIENPRGINKNLVDAQQARRILDRLVGFELSPILWKKIKGGLSAGRVQSVAVRLIVEREREIKAFKATGSYKTTATFSNKDGSVFQSQMTESIIEQEEVKSILESCGKAKFKIEEVIIKPSKRNPSAPFTTASLQQASAQKLGFSVSRTMRLAQSLYESGYITYMRTDSVNLSNEALSNASNYIQENFGSKYSKTRRYSNKSVNAQEAHESIRPTSFKITNTESVNSPENKLYQLIWRRTLASQMSSANIEVTTYKIKNNKTSHIFQSKGEVILFDGFLKLYQPENDEGKEQTGFQNLPKVKEEEILHLHKITSVEKYSRPLARFSEASLVKKLEELGIGRPSTYAPTISTIQKREYVIKKDNTGTERFYNVYELKDSKIQKQIKKEMAGKDLNKLNPTEIGILVNDFLVKHFSKIMDYKFTANVEQQFDSIASGEENWTSILNEFYVSFEPTVKNVIKTAKSAKGERVLGVDSKTGKEVIVRLGRYGPLVQLGNSSDEQKPVFASIRNGIPMNEITLKQALALFEFPKELGEFEGNKLLVGIGKYGPFVQHGKKYVSLPKNRDLLTVSKEEAIELIHKKREDDAKKVINTFEDNDNKISILNGPYGPYIKIGRKNYKIPKGKNPKKLSLKECLEISQKKLKK